MEKNSPNQDTAPKNINRRLFIKVAAVGALAALFTAACGKDDQELANPTPVLASPTATVPATAEPVASAESMDVRIQKKVQEIISTYPEDSPFRSIYQSGPKPPGVSYAIPLPVAVAYTSVTDEYASINFADRQFEDISFFAEINEQRQEYFVLKSHQGTIGLSSKWEDGPSILVQKLIMEKEALMLLLWNDFAKFALQVRVNQGAKFFGHTEISPTPLQVQEEIGWEFYENDLSAHDLFDYSGYLALMPQVDAIMNSTDTNAIAMMYETNIPEIWQLAKNAGVDFNHPIGSDEFIHEAYSPKSTWGQIILSDSVKGRHNGYY